MKTCSSQWGMRELNAKLPLLLQEGDGGTGGAAAGSCTGSGSVKAFTAPSRALHLTRRVCYLGRPARKEAEAEAGAGGAGDVSWEPAGGNRQRINISATTSSRRAAAARTLQVRVLRRIAALSLLHQRVRGTYRSQVASIHVASHVAAGPAAGWLAAVAPLECSSASANVAKLATEMNTC